MQFIPKDAANHVLSFLISGRMRWVPDVGLADYHSLLYHEAAWWSRVVALGLGALRCTRFEGYRGDELSGLKVPSRFQGFLVAELVVHLLEERRWIIPSLSFALPSAELQAHLLAELLRIPQEEQIRVHRCPCRSLLPRQLARGPPFRELFCNSFCCSFFFDRKQLHDFVAGTMFDDENTLSHPIANSTSVRLPGCSWLSMHLDLSPDNLDDALAHHTGMLAHVDGKRKWPSWILVGVQIVIDRNQAPEWVRSKPPRFTVDCTLLQSGARSTFRFSGVRKHCRRYSALKEVCASPIKLPEQVCADSQEDQPAVVHCAVQTWMLYLGKKPVWPWCNEEAM